MLLDHLVVLTASIVEINNSYVTNLLIETIPISSDQTLTKILVNHKSSELAFRANTAITYMYIPNLHSSTLFRQFSRLFKGAFITKTNRFERFHQGEIRILAAVIMNVHFVD